jgi:hypothetical protein
MDLKAGTRAPATFLAVDESIPFASSFRVFRVFRG